ncbi:MAG: DNA primase [Microbacteriaceae bacterium]|nr:DNA primase [Microbacteriaceae bacterium]
MAGRIRQSDIEELKSRVNIADIVSDHVSLKNAGVGSLKGLCPFHDERSPSFHVRPGVGYYHCFGCGESGDVFSFVQKMDHLSFTETIERLAERIGFELHYEEGGGADPQKGSRVRILAANQAAQAFFIEQLVTPEAAIGRTFLGERGFDKAAAEMFGIGYAPKGWNGLRDALRAKGFNDEELQLAGLVSSGEKGVYDRFRGRLVWPIRDVTGQTIGFGARKLYDDDNGPKYLNTPETPVYHKSQVLYGLDLAKRDISKLRQVVVVEGYTDVMAAHLSGVTTAIATCGTAFGVEHIKIIRRIMGDDSGLGSVIFTFDPDAAGQKAALRAFSEEQRFAAATFVAVAPEGLDPCDLRLNRGEHAVRELIANKIPMFEFVIRQVVSRYDLDTVEGRVAALREAAPIVADIRDASLKPGYTRELARITGVEVAEAQAAVGRGGTRGTLATDSVSRARVEREGDAASGAPAHPQPVILGNDPATRMERDAVMAMLQLPADVGPELLAEAAGSFMSNSHLAVIRDAIGANQRNWDQPTWIESVSADVPDYLRALVMQLAVAPLPERSEREMTVYARAIVVSLVERDVVRRKSDLVSRMQRLDPSAANESREIQQELVALEAKRRRLRDE